MEMPQAQRDEALASASGKAVPMDPSEADTEDGSVFMKTTAQQAPPTVITTPPSTVEQEKPKSLWSRSSQFLDSNFVLPAERSSTLESYPGEPRRLKQADFQGHRPTIDLSAAHQHCCKRV